MNALDYVAKKYKINLGPGSPIEIPNVGRDNLAELFAELGFLNGIEVGTENGLYAEVLCKANPKLKLTCVDSWKAYPGLTEYVAQTRIEAAYQEAKRRLSKYNCKLIRAFSMDAVKNIPDNSLDFVYIDANHAFNYVMEDLTEWSKKVRVGGIVSGHDYFPPRANAEVKCDVIEALHDFTIKEAITPWFILGNKWVKMPGEIRDKYRSWMWVKNHQKT
jgi:hypothetical protein